ncbi:MAG TPA: hypothetical protein VF257_12605 [Solirubrobacteraceae bacterium]
MNALCRAYDSTHAADAAVRALIAGEVPPGDIRVLMGAERHDARREAGGAFAGKIAPESRVGAFAGDGAKRATPRSSFAGEAAPDREGTFANADRDVVVTHSDGEEHVRVAGHRQLKELLVDAGLDDAAAEADVHALHEGRVLVLVTLGATSPERAVELLDQSSR